MELTYFHRHEEPGYEYFLQTINDKYYGWFLLGEDEVSFRTNGSASNLKNLGGCVCITKILTYD